MNDTIRQLTPAEFPPLLAEIPDPPTQLRLRGNLPLAGNKILSVVGARRMSPYGKQACEKIIAGLSGYPITIVSGLALGVDACAHHAALAAKLPTIAVPGSGLSPDVIYPRSHISLANEIVAAGGGIMSEFPDDFIAAPWAFPKRNRVMAGMSHAVLIIEAEIKSGTLITARLAADYNREVLAVPGPIFSELSRGGNMLLKKGAALIESAADVLDVLGFKASEMSQQSTIPNLSPDETAVWKLLETPISKDDLLRKLKLPISEAQSLLSAMEIKGFIQEELGAVRRC